MTATDIRHGQEQVPAGTPPRGRSEQDMIAATIDDRCDTDVAVSAQAGEERALVELMARLRPCVSRLVLRSKRGVIDKDDAVSICTEAIMKALHEYDPARGNVMMFLLFRARIALIDAKRGLASSGRHNRLLAAKFRAASARAREECGRTTLSAREFAAAQGISMRRALRIAVTAGGAVTLDSSAVAGGGACLYNALAADDPSPGEVAEQQSDIEFIMERLSTLDQKTRTVVESYFGLNGRPADNFATIGRNLGLSPQRAQQILQGGLQELRVRSSRIHSATIPSVKAPDSLTPPATRSCQKRHRDVTSIQPPSALAA